MKIIKAVTLLLSYTLAASCTVASTNTIDGSSNSRTPEEIIGRWSPDCEKISGINIHSPQKIIIEINANQIYVLAAGVVSGDILSISLESPEDLGRGGMMLEWNNFSRTTPIAKMKLISDSTSTVEWLGFYNERLGARVWISEPDFLAAETNLFSKCRE